MFLLPNGAVRSRAAPQSSVGSQGELRAVGAPQGILTATAFLLWRRFLFGEGPLNVGTPKRAFLCGRKEICENPQASLGDLSFQEEAVEPLGNSLCLSSAGCGGKFICLLTVY